LGEAILVDNECDGITDALANNEANILFFSHNLLLAGILAAAAAAAADWMLEAVCN
jgi:hypothetical protein